MNVAALMSNAWMGKGFNVTLYQSSINAALGSSHTLYCNYTQLDLAELKRFHVSWGSKSPAQLIWLAGDWGSGPVSDSQRTNGSRLSGSSGNLSDIILGHSITFTSIQLEDEGEYYCSVEYKVIGSNGGTSV